VRHDASLVPFLDDLDDGGDGDGEVDAPRE
jgi:hypothetical protein